MEVVDNIMVCGICKCKINLDMPFAEFIHYRKKKEIISAAFYHVDCFRQKLTGAMDITELKEKANQILEMAAERLG